MELKIIKTKKKYQEYLDWVDKMFDKKVPMISSTKAFTGHTLGASGGIEAVFAALAVQEGIIYPNAHFTTPMKECPLVPATAFSSGNRIPHVMSNSFGFGGNCSSLVFSKQ